MASDKSDHASSDGEVTHSSLTFPVVGIGASAGGLEPLTQFFEAMPAASGMAFVVVVHLSPTHVSGLPALLQAATRMPVVTPDGPQRIEPDHVYVISPDKLFSMNDGYLRVTNMERTQGRQIAIDLFFRSLAAVHRERAVAVVLSGAGADGAVGLARIKEEGGITIVQRPEDAQFDSMPRAAIATGAIDWVLPVAAMPRRLVEMWANARSIELPHAPEEDEIKVPPPATPEAVKDAEDALRDILILLRTRTGHDFRNYKRATVLRRLERRLQVHGLPNLPAYRSYLQGEPEEAPALLRDMLIGVTNFFRDAEAFDALQSEALPQLFNRPFDSSEGLRVWVPGCATGEEAYSIAMLLAEEATRLGNPPSVHIFATDIDEAAIAAARLGAYPAAIETDVPAHRLRRFFDKDGHQYRIRTEVREKVTFAAHNILRDPPFSKLDLISCRNLLIYLDRDVHAEVLDMFHFALRPGGFLFLGSSETADIAGRLFSVVDKRHRIFRANVVARATRFVPNPPAGKFLGPASPSEARQPKRPPTYAELHQRLAEQYAPPSVLIDSDANIVHLSDQAGRFLRHAGGEPSRHLLNLVEPELRLELRTAVYQALRSGKCMEARPVKIQQNGQGRHVKMIVRPVQDPQVEQPLVLVLFDDAEDSMATADLASDESGRDPSVLQLEEELRRTKEQLQSTIEQSETSTEELKASNEELQAINEELRSTTEELETSKEELQSINEELITVNNELKTKVEETGKINDDLQNLISSTDIATVFVDRAMSIKRFTPHATRLFNLIPTDVGRSLLDITHRLDYQGLAQDAADAFQSLRMIEREVVSEDGRWYLARVLPYRTMEDRIDGAVLTFVDITSRRHAEEGMRLVAESTKDHAIITTDLSGKVTTWNKGAERIFGYTEMEMVGQPAEILFVVEDRAANVPQDEMRRAREEGRAEDDRWHLRKDGTRFFCSGIMTPMYGDGALRGYAKIARDITGSKRAEHLREARLRQQSAERAAAEAANQLKDEFLAVMSHELKNPLNLIQLNAELLARMPEARDLPAVVRATDTIRRSVLSQAQIIDDMLDLSRINTGKLKLERAPVDLAATARMIVEALASGAKDKQIELEVQAGDAPVMVHADRTRVEQITWNLVSNAIKFTPAQGRVAVKVSQEAELGRLDVEDNGRGLAPDFVTKAFEMFMQAKGGPSRRQGSGLGIGLALVRSLTEMHGGRVEAHSDGIDKGARFTVWLPMRHSDRDLEVEAAKQPIDWLAGRRVLIVDDDLHSVETLRQLLEIEGATVVATSSAPGALTACAENRFDIVITDIAMPDMDGYQLLDALRASESTVNVPVIAVTGFGRPTDVKRAIAAGFDAHLRKPITLERLLRTLEQVLLKN